MRSLVFTPHDSRSTFAAKVVGTAIFNEFIIFVVRTAYAWLTGRPELWGWQDYGMIFAGLLVGIPSVEFCRRAIARI